MNHIDVVVISKLSDKFLVEVRRNTKHNYNMYVSEFQILEDYDLANKKAMGWVHKLEAYLIDMT